MKLVSCGLLYWLYVMPLVLGQWEDVMDMGTNIQELALGERSGEFRILFLPSADVLWRSPLSLWIPAWRLVWRQAC